eukprot:1158392-Pelagomonas_calceolata.AAC.9
MMISHTIPLAIFKPNPATALHWLRPTLSLTTPFMHTACTPFSCIPLCQHCVLPAFRAKALGLQTFSTPHLIGALSTCSRPAPNPPLPLFLTAAGFIAHRTEAQQARALQGPFVTQAQASSATIAAAAAAAAADANTAAPTARHLFAAAQLLLPLPADVPVFHAAATACRPHHFGQAPERVGKPKRRLVCDGGRAGFNEGGQKRAAVGGALQLAQCPTDHGHLREHTVCVMCVHAPVIEAHLWTQCRHTGKRDHQHMKTTSAPSPLHAAHNLLLITFEERSPQAPSSVSLSRDVQDSDIPTPKLGAAPPNPAVLTLLGIDEKRTVVTKEPHARAQLPRAYVLEPDKRTCAPHR